MEQKNRDINMNQTMPKKNPIKKWIMPIVVLIGFFLLFLFDAQKGNASIGYTWDYFIEMALILPPIFILMGLIEVWIPKDKIQKWLGGKSGIKGSLLSIALGSLPTGPLYIAFPMTAMLMKKGASVKNIILFLGAWAALKIPQLMVEIKFLGIEFAALRFVLTLIGLVIIGEIMELILKKPL